MLTFEMKSFAFLLFFTPLAFAGDECGSDTTIFLLCIGPFTPDVYSMIVTFYGECADELGNQTINQSII